MAAGSKMGKASTTPKGKVMKSGTLTPVRGGKTKMFGKQTVMAAKPR